jgi:hypothetical protein
VIDNKASLAIAKTDLARYYASPSENVELICLDNITEDLKKDKITYDTLKQNTTCISAFETHDQSLAKADDELSLFTINNPQDREVAKKEALSLLHQWKNGIRK